jgi:hypothetical protein
MSKPASLVAHYDIYVATTGITVEGNGIVDHCAGALTKPRIAVLGST